VIKALYFKILRKVIKETGKGAEGIKGII